jgi:cobalt-zinc-cadmium efflux system outer membrane protein
LQIPNPITTDETQLIAQALACRPDYHAARWTVAAASERSKLSRWLFLRLDGVLDVRDGPGYTRTGGGLRADIPIFNRNQGGILRADWEVNGSMHARDAIHDQIVMDVRTAARQLRQAQDNLTILTRDVAPALADALSIAKKGFADGGTDYLLVLQTTTQYLDARAKILDQTAACRKALAELERSVGTSLEDGILDVEALAQAAAPPSEAPAEQSETPAQEMGELADAVLLDEDSAGLNL